MFSLALFLLSHFAAEVAKQFSKLCAVEAAVSAVAVEAAAAAAATVQQCFTAVEAATVLHCS